MTLCYLADTLTLVPEQANLATQSNDGSFSSLHEELVWRGLIHVSTDEKALSAALGGAPISFYCGFDPTAPSLHLGNLVQLLLMRRLQLAGHKPLALVGGSTGLIGDPKPTAERVLREPEVIASWVEALGHQVSRFLDFSGSSAATLVNNLDWTKDLSAIDFLRDIGKYYRVGTMLKKDAVAARLNSDAGISYTEFSYQILQGMDFLRLYENYGCLLQTGGSDQWGNLTSGTDLIHKALGVSVHAVGTPLITNSDGTKFGKSEGNAIWLDEALTSPYAMYQFWLNTDDRDVVERLKIFTFLTRSDIEALETALAQEPHKRLAQKALALDVTSLVHGREQALAVREASEALFGKDSLESLNPEAFAQALAELPSATLNSQATIAEALVATGLCQSASEARRAITQGGVSLNNVAMSQESDLVGGPRSPHPSALLLKRGKKTFAALYLSA